MESPFGHNTRSLRSRTKLETPSPGPVSLRERGQRTRRQPSRYGEQMAVDIGNTEDEFMASEHSEDADFEVRRSTRRRKRHPKLASVSEQHLEEYTDDESVGNERRTSQRLRGKNTSFTGKKPAKLKLVVGKERGDSDHADTPGHAYPLRRSSRRLLTQISDRGDELLPERTDMIRLTRSGRVSRPTERYMSENGAESLPYALKTSAPRRKLHEAFGYNEQTAESAESEEVAGKRPRTLVRAYTKPSSPIERPEDPDPDHIVDDTDMDVSKELDDGDQKGLLSSEKEEQDVEPDNAASPHQAGSASRSRYPLRGRKEHKDRDHSENRKTRKYLKRNSLTSGARRYDLRSSLSRRSPKKRPRRASFLPDVFQESRRPIHSSASDSELSSPDPSESSSASSLPEPPLRRDLSHDHRSWMSRGWRRRTRKANLAGDTLAPGTRGDRAKRAGIEPLKIDLSLTWDDVGGLDNHIRTLKEMVFLPLLYPEVFERFKMEPPKGVLFYGPPGTGKTLCARALAASCGVAGNTLPKNSDVESIKGKANASGNNAYGEDGANQTRKPRVSFFMRNGADCLSKWVGEAERHLRMTFEAAKAHQPSIIFFDEIDGLAPVRSARQDQIHSSIVSTLLGLMDGLDSRGRIVVIGATNRVDAIDPALRRPGRFDRELIFTLPNVQARRKILEIHTSAWKPPPMEKILQKVAEESVGYCGADLRALCAEAALRALRRRYPQIYQSSLKYVIDVNEVNVSTRDFVAAMQDMVPASHRAAKINARPIPARLRPLLSSKYQDCIAILKSIFPHGVSALTTEAAGDDYCSCGYESPDDDEVSFEVRGIENAGKFRESSLRAFDELVLRPRLLICGKSFMGQDTLGAALLHYLESCPVHSIDLAHIYSSVTARTPEEALMTNVREACRSVPSILYLPHLELWWSEASPSVKTTLRIALRDIPANIPVFVLATADSPLDELDEEVATWFSDVALVEPPNKEARMAYFAGLVDEAVRYPRITEAVLERRRKAKREEVLEVASMSKENHIAEETPWKRRENERYFRTLRMEMRKFVEQLLRDRKYRAFRDPVRPDDAPDYAQIISSPMDLKTIATKLDDGRYPTVVALIADIDLMVQNAIKYNPKNSDVGFAVLRSAHALFDHTHAWADKLNPVLVERCNAIISERLRRKKNIENKAVVDVSNHEAKPLADANGEVVVRNRRPGGLEQDPEIVVNPVIKPFDDISALPNGHSSNNVRDSERQESQPELESLANGEIIPNGIPKEISSPHVDKVHRVEAEVPNVHSCVEIQTGDEELKPADEELKPADEELEPADTEPFVPSSEDAILELNRLLVTSTESFSIDALESIYTKCGTVLRQYQRSKNRKEVVSALIKTVQASL